MIEAADGGCHHHPHRAEHPLIGFRDRGLGDGASNDSAQLLDRRLHEQPVELPDLPRTVFIEVLADAGEQYARVFGPLPVPGHQRARELLDVVGRLDLGKEIPAAAALIERVQDQIATPRIIEALRIAEVRVREHDPVAALERLADELPDRRTLAGSRGPDNLEVLRLVEFGHGDAGDG